MNRELNKQVARYRIVPMPQQREVTDELQQFVGIDGKQYVCQRRRRLPSPEAVARAVAIYQFCNGPNCTLLMRSEIERYFPSVFRAGLPFGYYVEIATESPTLGLIRVDTRLLPISVILRRSQDLIERHARDPPFRKLLAQQRFRLTWLVATPTKVHAIHDATARDWPIRVVVIPELLELVMPLANTPRCGGFVTGSRPESDTKQGANGFLMG